MISSSLLQNKKTVPRLTLPHRKAMFACIAVLATIFLCYGYKGTFVAPANSKMNLTFYCIMIFGSSALCFARAFFVKQERLAWAMVGLSLTLWGFGETYFNFMVEGEIPFPSIADAGYLLFYIPIYIALWQLARHRLPKTRGGLWLDGLVAVLTITSLTVALLAGPIVSMLEGSPAVIATTLAYPVGDFILMAMLAAGLGIAGGRIDGSLALLALAFFAFWLSDSAFLIGTADGSYVSGRGPDMGWPLAAILLATASWIRPPAQAPKAQEAGAVSLMVPLMCMSFTSALLVYGNFGSINSISLGMALVTIGCILIRVWLVFKESKATAEQMMHASTTDELTGLGNRRKLLQDLETEFERIENDDKAIPSAFLLYDLNGFKAYNDTYGHPAGDALLKRLATHLAISVDGVGRAYRLGGDEFCVLLPADSRLNSMLNATTSALSESGQGFTITTAHGLAVLPDEAKDIEEAMRFADRRMYAQKSSSRTSAGTQMRDVLLRALAERDDALGDHNDDVAELAREVALSMGLTNEQVDEVVRAAELHDVGKLAIPDSILFKPGPLTEDEWVTMKLHTITGERILMESPALKPVGRLVRSSHERWDGGGYPDKLSGEAIPLGARIVAVCDAYDAMVTDRPYRKGMSHTDALSELARCEGSQFDPRVIEAFMGLMRSRDNATSRPGLYVIG